MQSTLGTKGLTCTLSANFPVFFRVRHLFLLKRITFCLPANRPSVVVKHGVSLLPASRLHATLARRFFMQHARGCLRCTLMLADARAYTVILLTRNMRCLPVCEVCNVLRIACDVPFRLQTTRLEQLFWQIL